MPPYRAARVLIVARRTADSPQLFEAVARRARQGPCNFTLLVPAFPRGLHPVGDHGAPGQRAADPGQRATDPGQRAADPGQRAAERRIATAVPLLSRAAGAEVVAVIGAHEPFAAVRDALQLMGYDEVIVSMLPARVSRWLHLELPVRIRALGVPVTEVIATEAPASPLPAA
ncbi:MAG: hypothetical protein JO027_08320 [Solirubrobacterales bacterium]|nr:hypothetical protein [Solirubrobacterales bacterium]